MTKSLLILILLKTATGISNEAVSSSYASPYVSNHDQTEIVASNQIYEASYVVSPSPYNKYSPPATYAQNTYPHAHAQPQQFQPYQQYSQPYPQPYPQAYQHPYPGSPTPSVDLTTLMQKLPDKLDFLPKIATAFVALTKILLKILVVKVILKFIVMFCLFFFVPKLDFLEMQQHESSSEEEMEMMEKPGKPGKPEKPEKPGEDSAETPGHGSGDRKSLKELTKFVTDAIENRSFLKKEDPCKLSKYKLKCHFYQVLLAFDNFASIPRIYNAMMNQEKAKFH